MGEVKNINGTNNTKKSWIETMNILGTNVEFKIDTGAETNLIPHN